MPKTQVTLTAKFTESGTSNKTGKPWTRTDFKTEDGQRFQTFDATIASKVAALVGVPIELEYEIQESGQYVNNNIIDAVSLASDAEVQVIQAETAKAAAQPKAVDYNAAAARAIEALAADGESVLAAIASGQLWEFADMFVEYSQGVKPVVAA